MLSCLPLRGVHLLPARFRRGWYGRKACLHAHPLSGHFQCSSFPRGHMCMLEMALQIAPVSCVSGMQPHVGVAVSL